MRNTNSHCNCMMGLQNMLLYQYTYPTHITYLMSKYFRFWKVCCYIYQKDKVIELYKTILSAVPSYRVLADSLHQVAML